MLSVHCCTQHQAQCVSAQHTLSDSCQKQCDRAWGTDSGVSSRGQGTARDQLTLGRAHREISCHDTGDEGPQSCIPQCSALVEEQAGMSRAVALAHSVAHTESELKRKQSGQRGEKSLYLRAAESTGLEDDTHQILNANASSPAPWTGGVGGGRPGASFPLAVPQPVHPQPLTSSHLTDSPP
jgi:hypothetical protein